MDDEGKEDKELFNSVVIEGLKLLQNDYLGGGGSRGNGRIKFVGLKDETGKEYPLEDIK
jgi:CRISPR-associated protein Csm3